MRIRGAMLVAMMWAAGACDGPKTPAHSPTPLTAPSSPLPAAAVSFVNRVWQVSDPGPVSKGTLYVFLSEGTLVVASGTGTPSFGQWKQEHGQLTMIEEGIAYPTDILELTADHFRIRSHNPGEPVEIGMVAASTTVSSPSP